MLVEPVVRLCAFLQGNKLLGKDKSKTQRRNSSERSHHRPESHARPGSPATCVEEIVHAASEGSEDCGAGDAQGTQGVAALESAAAVRQEDGQDVPVAAAEQDAPAERALSEVAAVEEVDTAGARSTVEPDCSGKSPVPADASTAEAEDALAQGDGADPAAVSTTSDDTAQQAVDSKLDSKQQPVQTVSSAAKAIAAASSKLLTKDKLKVAASMESGEFIAAVHGPMQQQQVAEEQSESRASVHAQADKSHSGGEPCS